MIFLKKNDIIFTESKKNIPSCPREINEKKEKIYEYFYVCYEGSDSHREWWLHQELMNTYDINGKTYKLMLKRLERSKQDYEIKFVKSLGYDAISFKGYNFCLTEHSYLRIKRRMTIKNPFKNLDLLAEMISNGIDDGKDTIYTDNRYRIIYLREDNFLIIRTVIPFD